MFTTIANDLPLSRHATNFDWTELAPNKLCLAFHTDSNSNANAVVMIQTVEFSDSGEITWGTVRYVKLLGVRCRFSMMRIQAMDEERVVIITPNQSVAGTINGVAGVAAGVAPTGNYLNIDVVEVSTGKVLKAETVTTLNDGHRADVGLIWEAIKGANGAVAVFAVWGHAVGANNSVTLYQGNRFLISSELSITSTHWRFDSSNTGGASARTVVKFQKTRYGLIISGTGNAFNSYDVGAVRSTSSSANPNRSHLSTNYFLTNSNSNNTVSDAGYRDFNILPLENRYLIFGSPDGDSSRRYAAFSVGNDWNFSTTSIDMQVNNSNWLHADVAHNILCVFGAGQVPYSLTTLLNNTTYVQDSYDINYYSRYSVDLSNIYEDVGHITRPPAQIRRQLVPYRQATGKCWVNPKVVYILSDRAIALISCFTDKETSDEDFLNSERPAIVILKVDAPEETQEP